MNLQHKAISDQQTEDLAVKQSSQLKTQELEKVNSEEASSKYAAGGSSEFFKIEDGRNRSNSDIKVKKSDKDNNLKRATSSLNAKLAEKKQGQIFNLSAPGVDSSHISESKNSAKARHGEFLDQNLVLTNQRYSVRPVEL